MDRRLGEREREREEVGVETAEGVVVETAGGVVGHGERLRNAPGAFTALHFH